MNPRRVLIFRPGSLGDTVVSLPCLHLAAAAFPDAERRILTYSPLHSNYAAAWSVLAGSGLVHGYFEADYRALRRSLIEQFRLMRRIRAWKPDVLVYLTLPRTLGQALAESAFFRICGIRKIIGVPYRESLRKYNFRTETGFFESEAERLARCVAALGDARPADPRSWDLRLSTKEREAAARYLRGVPSGRGFIALSVGAAMDAKDWGADHWASLVAAMEGHYAGWPLVMVGGPGDFERSERVARSWSGVKLNLCGKLAPRETASALERASVYLGHDSGPIHLAAAVGTPCVGIYASRNPPGIWFPFGSQHKVIYHRTECSGCELKTCVVHNKRCIRSISVSEVLQALRVIDWRGAREDPGPMEALDRAD